jgi:hypothetical protein
VDIDKRLNNCFKITNIINSAFILQKYLKKTRIKLYNTIDLPTSLCNSESWTAEARDAKRMTAEETKYMRNTAGKNGRVIKQIQIARELNITLFFLKKYRNTEENSCNI